MKIPTLLYAEIRDDDHGCCAATCPDLDAGSPTACMRFGNEACVELRRDDRGRIVRCAECVAAERAHDDALDVVRP